MRRVRSRAGFTLTEAVLAAAVTGLITASAAGLIAGVIKSATKTATVSQAQEGTRLGLMRVEEHLVHASQVRVASATFVEYVVDLDQSPLYDRLADPDGDGIPNYLDSDRDADASLLLSATAQWQIGFNLVDDDEDSDGQLDVRQRIYLSGGSLWLDTSVNGAAWGGASLRRLAPNVSTFTFTYYGNKANALGKNVDSNNDGVITAAEIDDTDPPTGGGNSNGALDAATELSYLTTVRIDMGVDSNRDGKTDYQVQTDVYPPLLPLKSESF